MIRHMMISLNSEKVLKIHEVKAQKKHIDDQDTHLGYIDCTLATLNNSYVEDKIKTLLNPHFT
ncbi:hypothetical protein ATHSA_1974 [Athalassotoga saccharophila]|nr:hypothetical protein ATHSA_1974 [Athalassotoga saccharophila]